MVAPNFNWFASIPEISIVNKSPVSHKKENGNLSYSNREMSVKVLPLPCLTIETFHPSDEANTAGPQTALREKLCCL